MTIKSCLAGGEVKISILCVTFVFCQPILASELDRFDAIQPRSASERRLIDDLADAVLDEHDLIESALIAAGHADAADVRVLENRFHALVDSAELKCATGHPQAIFSFLRRNVLHGDFQDGLCDVGQTLLNGDYNCLTATILFHALGDELGVPVQAIWEPAHVRCWLPDLNVIVETTSNDWSTMPLDGGRMLDPAELVAKVFYNRGVLLMRDGEYASALVATWTSCCLDRQDEQAESNVRACINNWSLDLAAKRDFVRAGSILNLGIELDPTYMPFFRNKAYLAKRFGL